MTKDTLLLIIRTRSNILFQGEVRAVSSSNEKGPFDILPHHAFFISIVQKMIAIHNLDGTTQQIPITEGVMHVEEGRIHIYLDYDTPLGEESLK